MLSLHNDKHLIDDAPACLRDIYEVRKILEAIEAEDLIYDEAMQQVRSGWSPQTMTDADLSRWEAALGVPVKSDATLDFRRARLFALFSLMPPYTEQAIRTFLSRYLADTPYYLSISGDQVFIRTQDATEWMRRDLYKILHGALPASVCLTIIPGYVTHQSLLEGGPLYHSELQNRRHESIFAYGREGA